MFYEGMHEKKEFELANVAKLFKGLTYKTLDAEQKRTIDNTFVQATIVKTDGSVESLDSVYQIFERLNAGGTPLTPHEIRVALYAGPFVEFLTDLNRDVAWRALYGPESPRLRDQEIILRFIALYVAPGDYARPLKKYLNDFAARHRDLSKLDVGTVRTRFHDASVLLLEGPGPASIRGRARQVTAALAEAVLVGLARRLDAGAPPEREAVAAAVAALMENPELDPVISRATADEESVRKRLALATLALGTA